MNITKHTTLLIGALLGNLCIAQSAFVFYHPRLQRWINRDPLAATEPMRTGEKLRFFFPGPWEAWEGANLYEFTRNSPTFYFDPDGRFAGITLPIRFGIRGGLCGLRIKDEVWADYGTDGPKHDPNDRSYREAHCVAHCRIQRECPGGGFTSFIGGVAKEVEDWAKLKIFGTGEGFDPQDMAASRKGREMGRNCPEKSCEEACKGTR